MKPAFKTNAGTLTVIYISPRFLKKNFFNVCLFLTERERETEHERGRGRERGGHRIRSRLWALSSELRAVSTEPDAGLELTDCEIMT